MSGTTEEVSLHDEIAAAFAATNSKTEDEEIDNSSVIDKLEEKENEPEAKAEGDKAPESKDSPEQKTDETPAEGKDAGAPESTTPEVKLDEGKAPTSWSPKVREKWAELPEEVRSEIIRREEASVNGVRRLQEEFAPVKGFVDGLMPYMQEAQQMGVNPAQYIHNVLSAERSLRSSDINARFEALLGIADQYGIPLREVINKQAGQELLPTKQQIQLPQEVINELQASRQFREEQYNNSLEREVNAFKEGKEFFEDVRVAMADLMDAGIASSLQDAYDKACLLHPEVRGVMEERARSGKTQEQFKQRQAAAAGATVKTGAAPEVEVETDDDDSTEAVIRKAIRDSSGRV